MKIKSYQKEFIKFALENKALLFGEFKLKSGRISPYFFNAGQFNTGESIARLGQFYAQAIVDFGIDFDIIFGPAYKGIPLSTTVAIALSEQHGINKPFCFNRKEVKNHGEGGSIVGAQLKGRVLIIDDVISKGLTADDTMAIIQSAAAQAVGMAISVDRQERGEKDMSAVEEVKQKYQIPIISIATLSDVMVYLKEEGEMEQLGKMQQYQAEFGSALRVI